MSNSIFNIPESQMDRLHREVAKLNRRADKIGCPHVEVVVHSQKEIPSPNHVERYCAMLGDIQFGGIPKEILDSFPKIIVSEVEIIGEGPKVEGYKFIGTLDHYTIPGKVVVQSVPGENVPPQFFDCPPVCDHCHKVRNRVETFVVESEQDGSHLQVGRQCLKDFFGHDPSAIARHLTRVIEFVKELEDEEEWGGRSCRSGDWFYYDKMKLLTTTVAVIRTLGWVPRSASSDTKTATVDNVTYVLDPPYNEADRRDRTEFIKSIKFNAEKDEKEAKAAIEWLDHQKVDPTNSYMHNLRLLSESKTIPAKMVGYWCSLVATYQRAMERLEYQKTQKRLNEYLGIEGDKIEVVVKCTGIRFTSGRFGAVTLHQMLTEEGHTLTWFASGGDSKMEIGASYQIAAGIKKHEEFNGWKQTHITRVKILKTIEEK